MENKKDPVICSPLCPVGHSPQRPQESPSSSVTFSDAVASRWGVSAAQAGISASARSLTLGAQEVGGWTACTGALEQQEKSTASQAWPLAVTVVVVVFLQGSSCMNPSKTSFPCLAPGAPDCWLTHCQLLTHKAREPEEWEATSGGLATCPRL